MRELKFEAYDVKKLPKNEAEQLCCTLATLCCQVYTQNTQEFLNEMYNDLFKKTTDKECFFNRVEIFKSNDQVVGYTHFYARKIFLDSGKKFNIVRGAVGILPEYRGNNIAIYSAIRHGTSYYAENLCDNSFYFGLVQNPISYHLICKHARVVYPRPGDIVSDEMAQLYHKLLEIYKIELISPWKSIHANSSKVVSTIEEIKAMKNNNSPYIQFYLINNPNYSQGFVIPLLAQSGLLDVMYSGSVFFKEYWRKKISNSFSNETHSHTSDISPAPQAKL